MLTAAAVRTAIYLHGLGVAILFFALRTDMPQFPSVMADIITLIFKDDICLLYTSKNLAE